jgi:CelD/BcsL family acetyltransferase involved in cellulose biosynthesis
VSVNFACFERLDEVARDAAGALDRAAQPSLYDRLDWFRLLEAHCPPPGKLLAVRAGADGKRSWLFLAVEGKTARPYAAWYSLRVGPIGSLHADAMTSLADALTARGLASLVMAPMEHPAPLGDALRATGWWVRVEPDKANWRIATEIMDFDTYWASRSGRLRNTVKRKAKAAGLDVIIHRRFDAAAWADYEAVYRESWKPEEGSFPFLRALASQEGAAGSLRLGVAKKDGRPIAVQLWTVENEEATIHKLAYAEDSKELSPGSILSQAMFRYALDEDHVAMIDYGVGDEPYKADWMDERRQLWRLSAWNPRTLTGLAGAGRAAASALAARLRSR